MTLLTLSFFSILSFSTTTYSVACIFERSPESAIVPGLDSRTSSTFGLEQGRFVRLLETDTRIEMSGPSTSAIVVDVVHKLRKGTFEEWRLSIHRCFGEPDKVFGDGQLVWDMSTHQPFNVRLRTLSHPTMQIAFPTIQENGKVVGYSFGIQNVGVFTVEPSYRNTEFSGFFLKRVVTRDQVIEPKKMWVGYKGFRFTQEGDFKRVPPGKQLVLEIEDGSKTDYLSLSYQLPRRPTGVIDDFPRVSPPAEGFYPSWLGKDLDDALERIKNEPEP